MQDHLIVKGQIDPIEKKNALEGYKPNECTELDRIVRTTIWMHLSKFVYYTNMTTFELWKTLRTSTRRSSHHQDISDSEPL